MVWYDTKWQEDHEVIISENCLIFLVLLFTCLVSQYYLQQYYYYIPATGITLLISMFVGGILRLCNGIDHLSSSSSSSPSSFLSSSSSASSAVTSLEQQQQQQLQFAHPFILGFSSNIFYFGLLPPILFYSGYYLKRKYFYQNMDSILTLAFLGTLISMIIITLGTYYYLQTFSPQIYSSFSSFSSSSGSTVAASTHDDDDLGDDNSGSSMMMIPEVKFSDCLLLATILSSTDPITTLAIYSNLSINYHLYYLVFGESILNDAVSVTMYNTLTELIDVTRLSEQHLFLISMDFLIIFALSSLIGYSMGISIAYLMTKFAEPARNIDPQETTGERGGGGDGRNGENASAAGGGVNTMTSLSMIMTTVATNENETNENALPRDGNGKGAEDYSGNNEPYDMPPPPLSPEYRSPDRSPFYQSQVPFSPLSQQTNEPSGLHSPTTTTTHSPHRYNHDPHHHPRATSPVPSPLPLPPHANHTIINTSLQDHQEMISIFFLFFICYFSFFLSETFQLSGIVTIFFCGISTRRYIMKNMEYSTKLLFTKMIEIIAYLMETSCFIIMGLSFFLISFEAYNFAFIAVVFGCCVVGRMIHVYSLLSLVNLGKYISYQMREYFRPCVLSSQPPPKYIERKDMHMTVCAGLRGAMAYTLAYSLPLSYHYREVFLATTAVVVLLTVFLFGGMTVPMIRWLQIPRNDEMPASIPTAENSSSSTFETMYIYPLVLRRGVSSSFKRRNSDYRSLPNSTTNMIGFANSPFGSGRRIRRNSGDLESGSISSGGGSVRVEPPLDGRGLNQYLLQLNPATITVHHPTPSHRMSREAAGRGYYSPQRFVISPILEEEMTKQQLETKTMPTHSSLLLRGENEDEGEEEEEEEKGNNKVKKTD